MSETTERRFTGKHMLLIMVSFFTVVIVVNIFMAYSATSSFAGLVVENSYVASQHFNEKLDAMRRQSALGWKVAVDVREDAVVVDARDSHGTPIRGAIDVEMTRPTTDRDDHELKAEANGYGPVSLPTSLTSGSWDATVTITADSGETYLSTHRVILSDPPEARP